tara:strand:+ start:2990 stop:3850 length:861 start_codon:yes stop_codon:yes gene_type:complete
MKRLIIFLLTFLSLIIPIKTKAFIPNFYLPNEENLKKTSQYLAKGAYQFLLYEQPKEALRFAKLALSLNPNDVILYAIMAETLIANKEEEEALIYIKKGKKINPQQAELWFLESSILLKKKLYKESIKSVKEGLNYSPKNINAIFQLGNLYLITNNHKKAITEFRKAFNINNSFWQALNNEGLAEFELKNYSKCKQLFYRAMEISKDAEPTLALATTYFKLGEKQEESFSLVKEALNKNPNYVNHFFRKEQLWGKNIEEATKLLINSKSLNKYVIKAKKASNYEKK